MNRERGFYHCFGCGEHGNAISFLMKYENLPFVDAVEKLASEFSMQVRYEGGAPKPKSGKPRLAEIMQRAMEFYRDKFNSDKFSQDYLHDRGLKNETIERFGIGFSPDAWHNLDAVFTRIHSADEIPISHISMAGRLQGFLFAKIETG
mgnify:CR=1 FL=1